jgi:5-dehydro-4-deoxyglucarate dehydratase
MAIAHAQEAQRLGAQGVLLLPHYLTEASQQGLAAHVEAVCRSVFLGVIVYNRGLCRLNPAVLEHWPHALAETALCRALGR